MKVCTTLKYVLSKFSQLLKKPIKYGVGSVYNNKNLWFEIHVPGIFLTNSRLLQAEKSQVTIFEFQNRFNIPWYDVPQIVTQSKYPQRDPELKDNWRGRARQDLSMLGDKVIKVLHEQIWDMKGFVVVTR